MSQFGSIPINVSESNNGYISGKSEINGDFSCIIYI